MKPTTSWNLRRIDPHLSRKATGTAEALRFCMQPLHGYPLHARRSPLFQKEPFHGRKVQLFHIIIIYRIHIAKLIFSAYTRTFIPPDLSICQIVKLPRTRLRHSGTKEGTDGNTRFSHGREEAGVSAFAFLGLLYDHRDIPSYAQVKGSRQRNRVFP